MAVGCQGKNHPYRSEKKIFVQIFRLRFRYPDKRFVGSNFWLKSPINKAMESSQW